MYKLEISSTANRELVKLKLRITLVEVERLRYGIESLAGNPRPFGVRKIKGLDNTYRIRTGAFRVVYSVYDDTDIVAILHIKRRNESTYRRQ